MAIRPPPGRAGRLWLTRRVELGRRGAEVLDLKRSSLLREQERLAARLAAAAEDWERRAHEAAAWNARAVALAGERRLRLASHHGTGKAAVSVSWKNALGAVFPAGATVETARAPDLVALGGGAAVSLSFAAHARALKAAATYAAARAALEAVSAELSATSRRLRAIETRWVPEHEAALARLELALDEAERDEITRVRWALRQTVRRTES